MQAAFELKMLKVHCKRKPQTVTDNIFVYVSDWQNAVIGLFIFSVAFGLLAIVLSMCGLCTSTLAKKIYYYHSAGEIYFICGQYKIYGVFLLSV